MDHYYSEKPSSREDVFKISINLSDDVFDMWSSSGLFSKQGLDKASELLIENSDIKNNKVLDLGCGYGVIGISLLRQNPNLDLTFSDINERALKLTRKNLQLFDLKGRVVKSFLFENINEKFDHIIANPPYAAGRDVCFKLIEDSFNHLNVGGSLQIVARHNKGGKILSKKIDEVFASHIVLAKQGGFRVYMGIKN